ncbi:S8 family peptidase [Jiangella asiatica]|uniref:Serine protease n=1 Tax=Jiangella asiatica TaxID=2530372 RepID=A0A4R5CJW9_9ACTN|nr:S8 family serine peptidase [Jiangella asiatica]TDE00589.1 serine protease [Jiangella asiatica]
MRRLLTAVSALAIVTGLGMSAGQATPTPSAPVVAPDEPVSSSTPVDVTLVTGDRVRVTPLTDGRQAVEVTPARRANGRQPSFETLERDGELHVIPDDMVALIPERLDPALFNITGLIEQGYDDASSDGLPLIVKQGDGRRTAAAVPAAEVTTVLESIGSVAVELDKDGAAAVGSALSASSDGAEDGRVSTLSGPLAGVERISLDGKVVPTLDESAAQVGAPAAWDAGLDGSGVTVAVLDTGIDPAHPDFAGVVVGEANFTDDATAADGFGHGSHVASIAAGTGAASDGRYRGVADGVDLLSGKVIGDSGVGQFSWTVEAMEWAAEQGADIVNMSLGPLYPGQGGELSEAVEALTAQNGTLFVVSAGNGSCEECVTHPASAPSALTVGAVDKSDELAGFSSRGPLPDTFDVKPDVTAPGVGIVAARSSLGTLPWPAIPVDDHYIQVDGTSMAAPHVTGLAALLLQAEPSLGAAELKSWLMNSAVGADDLTVYEQGAGRADVTRALDSRVIAVPGSVSLGYFQWPHDERAPQSRTVTYQNVTDEDIVLDLAVDVVREDGSAPPAGTLTVSAPTVTVPAGATAAVELVLDTAVGEIGLYGGYLIGSAADGTTVRTPVGYFQEREYVELRVSGIARDGRPARGSVDIIDVDDGSVYTRSLTDDPTVPCTEDPYANTACVRVPPGTYSVLGVIETMPAYVEPGTFGTALNASLVGDPELEVTEDTEVVLDARLATEVLVDTPDHETKRNVGAAMELMYYRAPEQGDPISRGRSFFPGSLLEERLFVQPTEDVSVGEFVAYTHWKLDAPQITLDVTAPRELQLNPQYYPWQALSDYSSQFPMLDGDVDTEIVDAGLGRPEDVAAVDLDGKVALIERSDTIAVAEQANNAAAGGAELVMIANDLPGVNAATGPPALLEVPTTWISHEEGEAVRALLADAAVHVAGQGIASSPFSYEVIFTEEGSIPAEPHYVADADELARVEFPLHSQLTEDLSTIITTRHSLPWPITPVANSLPYRRGHAPLTMYLTPGPVRWSHVVQAPDPAYGFKWPHETVEYLNLTSTERSYEPGEHDTHSWYEQPLALGASPLQPPTRTDDTVRLDMGVLDSAGNYTPVSSSWFEPGGLDTGFRLYRGEELITETAQTALVSFEAEPEPTEYRVEYDVVNDSPWAEMSTRTSSVWTFTSERPADGEQRVEPILGVDYDVEVDLLNRATHPRERKGPHEIAMTFSQPDGAERIPVDAVTLEISYDDGETWEEIRNVRERGDNHYVATLYDRSSNAEFVSLRLSAADEQGNTLEQEIIRAYAVSQR